MRQREAGEIVEFVFQSEDAARQASSSLKNDGHEVVSVDSTRVTIRKQA